MVEKFIAPTYPAAAIAIRASGDLRIQVEGNDAGRVTNMVVLSGHLLLQKVSEIAAAKWSFSPVPGTHFLTLTFSFRLPGPKQKENARLGGQYILEFTPKYYGIIYTPSSD